MKGRKITALPYILWCIAFTVIPLFLVVFFAFTTKDGGFTFYNLSKITNYGKIFLKSINLALIATIICFIIGYPLAYMLSLIHISGRT